MRGQCDIARAEVATASLLTSTHSTHPQHPHPHPHPRPSAPSRSLPPTPTTPHPLRQRNTPVISQTEQQQQQQQQAQIARAPGLFFPFLSSLSPPDRPTDQPLTRREARGDTTPQQNKDTDTDIADARGASLRARMHGGMRCIDCRAQARQGGEGGPRPATREAHVARRISILVSLARQLVIRRRASGVRASGVRHQASGSQYCAVADQIRIGRIGHASSFSFPGSFSLSSSCSLR
jgi:hypothetical protein